MSCSKCGQQKPSGDYKFCPSCGAPFRVAESLNQPPIPAPMTSSSKSKDDLLAAIAKQMESRRSPTAKRKRMLPIFTYLALVAGGVAVFLIFVKSNTQSSLASKPLPAFDNPSSTKNDVPPNKTNGNRGQEDFGLGRLIDDDSILQLEKESQSLEFDLEKIESELKATEEEIEAQKSRLINLTTLDEAQKRKSSAAPGQFDSLSSGDDSRSDRDSSVTGPVFAVHENRGLLISFQGDGKRGTSDPSRGPTGDKVQSAESDKATGAKRKRELELELQKSKNALGKAKEQLAAKKSNLTKVRDTINQIARWQDAQVVLTDSSHRALALRMSPDRSAISVTHTSDGVVGPWATSTAVRSGAPWVYSPELVRELKDIDEGTELNPAQVKSVQTLFRPREYYEPTSDKERPFITFARDGRKIKTMARYLGHSQGKLKIQKLDGSIEDVPAERVTPGSARLIDEKETQYLEDGEFLDACLIQAIQRLAAEPNEQKQPGQSNVQKVVTPVRMAIQVYGTGSNDDRAFCNYVGGRLGVSSSPNIARLTQLMESELYTKLVKLHDVDPRFAVVSPGKMSDEIKSSIDSYNAMADGLKIGAGISFFGAGFKTAADYYLQSEKVREKALDLKAQYSLEALRRSSFSHVLEVRVSPPVGDGTYHLDVRLINAKNREVVFADQGDRRYVVESSLYFPASGELAFAKSELGTAIRSGLMESSPVLPSCASVFKPIDDPKGCLVLREGGKTGREVYRTLFGQELVNVYDKSALFDLVTVDTIPKTERLRFAGYQTLRAVLPPSGFVSNVQGLEAKVTLGTLGGTTGLKKGDRLRVAAQKIDKQTNTTSTYALAVPMIVTSLDEKSAGVQIMDTGLQQVFPNDKVVVSDIVYATKSEMSVVTISPFIPRGPIDQKALLKLKWDNPVRKARLTAVCNNATVEVHNKLAALLHHWNVPTLPWDQVSKGNGANILESIESYGRFLPAKARVTHVISGEVAILTEDSCRFHFIIQDPDSKQVFKEFYLDFDVDQ